MMKIMHVHCHQKNTVKKKTSVKKMATKSEELATKIFGLVASWRLIQRLKKVIKKVNFKP